MEIPTDQKGMEMDVPVTNCDLHLDDSKPSVPFSDRKHLRFSALSEKNIFMFAKFEKGAGKLQQAAESLKEQAKILSGGFRCLTLSCEHVASMSQFQLNRQRDSLL